MLVIGLILFPVLMAAIAFSIPWARTRVLLLPITGAVHLTLTITAWRRAALADSASSVAGRHDTQVSWQLGGSSEWLVLDSLGRLALLLISVLFMLCALYAVGYLRYRRGRSNRIFCGCMLTMLAMMSLVTWSHHFGLMWVAIEATTLSAGPLIYFNRTARSIEASWKYLLIGSVGIALALLGSFFLAYASMRAAPAEQARVSEIPAAVESAEGESTSLVLEDLIQLWEAARLEGERAEAGAEEPGGPAGGAIPWLHAAFVLLFVGYGTKMGLAPMHTWKPDAYGEAPGLVGALLAGGATTCAFLAILRVYQVCLAAGEAQYAGRMLVFMALVSMAIAGAFMVGQRDFKRMLAYSSVEHMGILVLGIGIGGVAGGAAATFGALLHMINNGLAKSVMFLSAGNIHRAYDSKSIDHVRGAMRRLPISGSLFLAGFIAVTGSPPFGPFISEFSILNGAIGAGRYIVSGLFLLFLLIVFIGMGATVLTVVQGRPSPEARAGEYRDGFLTTAPLLVLMLLVLMLGLYIPAPLRDTLHEAAALLHSPVSVQPEALP